VLGSGGHAEQAGIRIGEAGSSELSGICCGRFVEALLFGLKPVDPAVFASAIGILLTCSLGAALLPAWRASRLDSTAALREE
jgi:hypothetical protein